MHYKRIKYIDMRYHKICQWVIDNKVINLVKTSTKKNLADMITQTILMEKLRASMNFTQVVQK